MATYEIWTTYKVTTKQEVSGVASTTLALTTAEWFPDDEVEVKREVVSCEVFRIRGNGEGCDGA